MQIESFFSSILFLSSARIQSLRRFRFLWESNFLWCSTEFESDAYYTLCTLIPQEKKKTLSG
jgi:hypothetical protein